MVHDQRVDVGDVQAGLDDRRADEHVPLAVGEALHDLREFVFWHLPVSREYPRLRHEVAQRSCRQVDALHAVVEEEDLPTPVQLALHRLLHEVVRALREVRLDRQPLLRRGLDGGDVAYAGHRHVERARDGRCREREHVHLAPQFAQPLLVRHAEAVLLVDDEDAEVLEVHVLLHEPVGADDHVHLAALQPAHHLVLLLRGEEPAEHLHPCREGAQAFGETAVVLLREDGRGHQHRRLFPAHHRLERSPQRDLRLAVAHVAADEPVHRARDLHVLLHVVYRALLIGRLDERKGVLHLPLPRRVVAVREALGGLAPGVERQQVYREPLGGLPCPRYRARPLLTAEAGQRRRLLLSSGVGRESRKMLHRHVEAVAARIFEDEVLAPSGCVCLLRP